MVEVFKTNVQEAGEATRVIEKLLEHLPGSEINFDLEDCDRVLRVQGLKGTIDVSKIRHLGESLGCTIEVLD